MCCCSLAWWIVSMPSFNSLELLSLVWLFVTTWTAACQASLSITNFRGLLRFRSFESVIPSNHLSSSVLCSPLLLPISVFPDIRVFSNESALHIRWPKYWHFSVNIRPSNEYSVMTSFKMDWLNLLAVQGPLKDLLQHLTSKVSILWCSAFFIIQLSHPYMPTGKIIVLTRWNFVGTFTSLLFKMPPRLLINYLPRS